MLKKIFLLFLFISGIGYAQIDPGNSYMLAQSYIQSAQYDKAKTILESLSKNQPANYEYFQALYNVYIQLKDYDVAIALIEQRMNFFGQDINLYGMLGTTYYLKGNENKAFDTWDNALKIFPQNEINYRALANYALERRAFEKAIQYLKKGQDVSSNPIYFAFDLANLYSITMQYKDASEEYCIILSQNPAQLNVVENKIISYCSKPGALSATIPVIEKYTNTDQINFKFLLARLYIEKKDFDKAHELYQKIDSEQKAQGVQLLSFAQFLLEEKNYNSASKTYEEIIDAYPNSPVISSAKLGYAKTLEAVMQEQDSEKSAIWKPYYNILINKSSESEKVISAYSEIIKIYPRTETANEALLRIGEIYLEQGNLTESVKYLQNLADNFPLSIYAVNAYLDLAKIFTIKNDLDKAASYYLKITAAGGYPVDKKNYANYRLAKIFFYKGEFDKTREYLDQVLDNLENNSANDALALSLVMNTSQNDSSNLVKFAHAEFLAEQNNFGSALAEYRVVSGDPQKLLLQNLAALRAAEMELALNNIDSAAAGFQRVADEGEKNIYSDKALYLLAKINEYSIGNKAKAIEIYQNLLAKFPNSLYLDDARVEIVKLKDNSTDKIE